MFSTQHESKRDKVITEHTRQLYEIPINILFENHFENVINPYYVKESILIFAEHRMFL